MDAIVLPNDVLVSWDHHVVQHIEHAVYAWAQYGSIIFCCLMVSKLLTNGSVATKLLPHHQ